MSQAVISYQIIGRMNVAIKKYCSFPCCGISQLTSALLHHPGRVPEADPEPVISIVLVDREMSNKNP